MPSHDDLPRTALPMPDRPRPGLTTYDARDPETSFAPITPLRPPAGAPNVLVILLDDVGFGASSVFGGPVDTPVAQRLADGGLRYTRFHTTALCSPTRQALLTGRNHHSVGMGAITELATAAPGYNTIRPNTKATLAETLRLNGYATAQVGKCHEVPVWETSPAGPFDRWPTGSGFEYFYGFVGGETNQYYPALYEGTTPVEPGRTPEQGYHLTEDLADHGVDWIRRQHALQPGPPVLPVLRPRRDPRPAPRPPGVVRPVRGPLRRRLGCAARGDLRTAEAARRDPGRRRADRVQPGDPALGRDARRPQAGAGPPDGGLRRVPGPHRRPDRPAGAGPGATWTCWITR